MLAISPLLLAFSAPTLRMAHSAARVPAVSMSGKIPTKNVWVTFVESTELSNGNAVAGFQYGQEIAVVQDVGGKLFAINNKIPPLGQPVTFCRVGKAIIEDPVTKTVFDLKTGKPVGSWCPSPLGKLLYSRISSPTDLITFPVRKSGGAIQVLVNVNAKAQFESKYWRGVLDAQGKVDGGYY
jgi:nitrite reductase/ring-hydroxylating ferredoxin subunit